MVDEFGMSTRKRAKTTKGAQVPIDGEEVSTASESVMEQRQQRIRGTNQMFENNKNGYGTFLSDKGELPRLSILDNYK